MDLGVLAASEADAAVLVGVLLRRRVQCAPWRRHLRAGY